MTLQSHAFEKAHNTWNINLLHLSEENNLFGNQFLE